MGNLVEMRKRKYQLTRGNLSNLSMTKSRILRKRQWNFSRYPKTFGCKCRDEWFHSCTQLGSKGHTWVSSLDYLGFGIFLPGPMNLYNVLLRKFLSNWKSFVSVSSTLFLPIFAYSVLIDCDLWVAGLLRQTVVILLNPRMDEARLWKWFSQLIKNYQEWTSQYCNWPAWY